MTRILDLVDNRAKERLLSEHGLSLLIEHRTERLLLDTGAGTALESNAAKLGVNLSGLTRIILSHSHYDHTGGLSRLHPTCPVHVGEDIMVPSYSKQPEKPMHPLGMPEASVAALASAEQVVTRGLMRIAEGIWLNGPIPRTDPLEHLRGFFYDAACTKPSHVPEEQALLTDDGVLVTGCCHAGIINTVESFRVHAELPRIRSIVGGLHLCWSSDGDIRRVAGYLRGLRLERLVLLHCTGDTASAFLAANMNCSVELGAAGRSWQFGSCI